MFPVWWVGLTALAGVLLSLIVLVVGAPFTESIELSRRQSIIASLVVGLSIFAWRLSGNIPELNDDPIGALSPNDWLCPAITYVFLGVYGAFWPPAGASSWAQIRALLTIVPFAVNVVTI
ncbi:MAG TPA: hypothetical protein VGL99_04770 [Chloroflexota bacterium]